MPPGPLMDGPLIGYCSGVEPPSHRLLEALCYPRGPCGLRLEEARRAGVEGFCYTGNALNPVILGKGHSSTVLLGVLRGGLVAVKVRRLDSKRDSLAGEGLLLEEASRHGAAPKPYYYSRDLIVMDYIPGPSLRDLRGTPYWPWSVLEALEAARALDAAGILHYELRRPWRHVLFTGSMKAVVIDFESAGRGCGSVSKLLGGLAPLLGGVDVVVRLRGLLRVYNRECSRDYYEEIVGFVRELLGLA